MPMAADDIVRLIKEGIPDADVEIQDLVGDGDHYAAHVVAKEFVGKTRVQQHKMVYEALQGRMGGVLHALALTTAAPRALSRSVSSPRIRALTSVFGPVPTRARDVLVRLLVITIAGAGLIFASA